MPRKRISVMVIILLLIAGCEPTAVSPLAIAPVRIKCDDEIIDNYLKDSNANISYYDELAIVKLSVVEDACRTNWRGRNSSGSLCDPNVVGSWTIGDFFRKAAGSNDVSMFASDWLQTWTNTTFPSYVNSFALPSRRNASAELNYYRAMPANYDLKAMPFRLLGFVNRVDLARWSPYQNDAPSGEFHVIFGLVGADNGKREMTVSLDYLLPFNGGRNAKYWANRFHELSKIDLALNSEKYNMILAGIIDEITRREVMIGWSYPNRGSGLLRVRSNERVLGSNGTFDMREFVFMTPGFPPFSSDVPCAGTLKDNCYLRPAALPQTPSPALNEQNTLNSWLREQQAVILNQAHVLPLKYGNVALRPGSIEYLPNPTAVAWRFDDPRVRHQFAYATCNGCHLTETGTASFHIFPRDQGKISDLSGYLQLDNLTSPVSHRVWTGLPNEMAARGFNEPRRRVCEVARILSGEGGTYSDLNNSIYPAE